MQGVRDRHDGERRNPWDEFECGHHYARSMASYSLLLALSGFSYSGAQARIGFAPRVSEQDFRTFFCVGSGWGTYHQKLTPHSAEVALAIRSGSLKIRELQAAISVERGAPVIASVGRRRIPARLHRTRTGLALAFDTPVTLAAGETLKVNLKSALLGKATGVRRG